MALTDILDARAASTAAACDDSAGCGRPQPVGFWGPSSSAGANPAGLLGPRRHERRFALVSLRSIDLEALDHHAAEGKEVGFT